MNWIVLVAVPEHETTRPSWIIRIIFKNLAAQQRLFDLGDLDSIALPFIFSVAAKLIVFGSNLLPDPCDVQGVILAWVGKKKNSGE